LSRHELAIGAALCLLASPAAMASSPDLHVEATVAALGELRARAAQHPEGLPTHFEIRRTAWQTTPLRLVLAGGEAPGEDDPYVLTHPLFVLRWEDGRILLVDAGLAPEGGRRFGRPAELLGAEPAVCGDDAFAGIAPSAIRAGVFSHLHIDHVQGLGVLCAQGTPIPIRLSPEQRASKERYEVQGREQLDAWAEAGCVRPEPFDLTDPSSPAPGLAGFRGVHRVATPGHTPGSQILVAFVRDGPNAPRAVVIAGDIVNHRAGFRLDRPKPWWYRRLIVREADALQTANRRLLARLDVAGFEILVNHDLGIPAGTPARKCP